MSTLLKNKAALYDNEVLETFEAGLKLHGYEVKSLRNKQGSLKGAYIIVGDSGAQLVGADIPAFQPANAPEQYDSRRARDLLLSKDELKKLLGHAATKGLTVVPISVYNKGRFLKLELAVVRPLKKFDKREKLKKHDTERDIEREFKHNVRL